MRIMINHLTRLKPGFICAAGINLATRQHVRPVLRAGLLSKAFLTGQGGYLELGQVLDLKRTTYTGTAPEVEDHLFEPGMVSQVCRVEPSDFWHILRRVSRSRLADLFGPDLVQLGRFGVVPVGGGRASLGTVRLTIPPTIFMNEAGFLRMGLTDSDFNLELSITDLRFYETDYKTPALSVINQAVGWCEKGGEIILSVGLSRAWQKPGDHLPRHWLQVNNVHFENNPLW